jgi:hypothetical protein
VPDIHTALGAGPPAGTLQVTLFIPSVNRRAESIDQSWWRDQALSTLGRLFRGATAFPPGRGVWHDEATGGLVYDDTIMVTSYIPAESLTDANLASLRAFLHQLGRDTNQGEIGLVIDSRYYGITTYDDPKE